MAGIPTFTTERLTLRPVLDTDAAGIFMLRSDPQVNQYLDRQPCKTMEDALHFISRIRNSHSLYWVITDNSTGNFIGTIGLFDFSADHTTCEIGYELLPAFQGKGFMREAAKSIMQFAVHDLEVRTIEAYMHRHNQRSAHLLATLRFTKAAADQQVNTDLLLFRWQYDGKVLFD